MLLPPFFDDRPSGIPTRARTRHEVGRARRRWNSTRYHRARAAGVSCGLRGLQVSASGWWPRYQSSRGAHFADRHQVLLGFVGRRKRNRQVGLREGGDLVLIGVLGLHLLLRAVVEVHVDASWDRRRVITPLCARVILGAEGSVISARKTPRHCGGIGAGAHIFDVEHHVLEVFVEDARLNLKGSLRTPELVLQAGERRRGHGGKPDAVGQRQQPGGNGEDGDDADKHPGAQAAGAHGGDFAVGGQAAEADEDSDQQAHGDGDGAGNGQGKQEEARPRWAGERCCGRRFRAAARGRA